MTLIAFVFWKLLTPKKWLRKSLKSSISEKIYYLYYIHWSLPSQLSWKNSLWLTCIYLGLFVNTLATDEKYLVLNRENLTILIQMQLSLRQETVSQVFFAILKFTLCSHNFEKKDYLQRFLICDIIDSENVVR